MADPDLSTTNASIITLDLDVRLGARPREIDVVSYFLLEN
jgi:hypothetical protein